MTTPVRLQLRRTAGYSLAAASAAANGLPASVVARPGRWGNPFVVGLDFADAAACVAAYRALVTEGVVAMVHADVAHQHLAEAWVRAHVHELAGRNLACWCPLDSPCHADVLLELARSSSEPPRGER